MKHSWGVQTTISSAEVLAVPQISLSYFGINHKFTDFSLYESIRTELLLEAR